MAETDGASEDSATGAVGSAVEGEGGGVDVLLLLGG